VNSAAQQQFAAAVASYAPETPRAQSIGVVGGYLAVDMYIRGLKAAGGCPTRASFIAALRNIHDYDGNGLIRPNVDLAHYREPNGCLNVVRVSADGAAFEPQGSEPVCGHSVPLPR
jgi:branched-chain amino acid transport system substrate-binding protein